MKLKADRDYKIPGGCGVAGIMSQRGKLLPGSWIVSSICNMLERGNGLGSGFAGYGIYPEFKDYWCFHIIFEKTKAKEETEAYLKLNFTLHHREPIPTKRVRSLGSVPLLWRYFLKCKGKEINEEDFIVKCVMDINTKIDDAFIFSSGKNMGIFKGVGNPDEIAEFYRIDEYKGYIWTAHNRFPTNTVGWWGGAHPFGILDWSLVHNGEISSYGINRRYLENFGYSCTLFTDTEVMVYLFDLLIRKHKLDFTLVGNILASPFWSQISRIEDKKKGEFLRALRIIYASALVNGPFGVIVANSEYMVGLNDRVKLRPLVAASSGDLLYIASEESAIKTVCPNPDRVWMPKAGIPTIGKLE